MYRTHSPNYLVKEPYSYYFRMKIPKDLHPIIARKELRYSLGTGNLSAAKTKARYLAGQIQQLFRDLQNGCFDSMKLSKEQIQDMVKRLSFLLEGSDIGGKGLISCHLVFIGFKIIIPFRIDKV